MISIALSQPIQAKLSACEQQHETWRDAHESAVLVYRVEDLLGDIVELFDDTERFEQQCLEAAIANPNMYDDRLDRICLSLQERQHVLAEAVAKDLLPIAEPHVGSEAHIANFRDRLEKMRVSQAYGYRKHAHDRSETALDEICDSLSLKRA